MIIEHEEFGIGEIMAGSERLDESTGILYADVLFEDNVRFDMAIGVMAEGMGRYPGGLRKSPNFYGNDPEVHKLIKQKFDEIEKNFGKPKQEKKPANEEVEQIDELSKDKLKSIEKNFGKGKQGVAEASVNKDMTGQTCEKCKKDKYQERSWNDDRDGTLRCSCGHAVDRWRKYEKKDELDELSKEKLSSYVKAKKAAIPYQAKDKEIEKAEKKIKKMNEDNEPKLSGYTEMSRMKGVESVARSIMSQNRDLRHEALISDFELRSHQANNNKGE